MTTERDVLDMLWDKYGDRPSLAAAPRYLVCEHPRTPAGDRNNNRILDCMVLDRYVQYPQYEFDTVQNQYVITGPPNHFPVLGFEVKVSRGDWLRELKDPSKADAWRRYCTNFYVATVPGVVKPNELPDGWGLMVNGRITKRSPYNPAEPMPANVVIALMGAAHTTGRLHQSLYQ